MLNKPRKSPGVTGNRAVDISVLLEKVLEKNHITDDINFRTLSERFGEVVGPLILPHVKVEKLDKKILTLKVNNSAWKSELYLQKNAIIGKCNLMLGKPVIQDIRLI